MLTMLDLHVPVCDFIMTEDGKRLLVHMENNCHVAILCVHNRPTDEDNTSKVRMNVGNESTMMCFIFCFRFILIL